ncbi:CHASE domain-containing protein [Alkalimarinus alittae]|uniref:histidine kinase n=1 Tax=Alkalimarinus alittae TaxID=2961619 RepID=A0ABY6MZK1_9ALTE|nr:CHASE domain-containing protein [Alkalimarinus alittae]UZE95276.1 CHASE domain-containing protein [Alkalimarinus alittae]
MNIILRTTLIALAYFIAGQAGSFFSIPPGFASSIWPAAGIGLATALIYGPTPAMAGVFIGSFSVSCVNFLEINNTFLAHDLIIPSVIASGSAIQALTGYLLIKKVIPSPIRFIAQKEILNFLLIAGPMACLVSATIAVTGLFLVGAVPISNLTFTWFTWWTGDTIGVLFFTPLIIIALSSKKVINHSRRLQVILPSIILFFTVSWFFAGSREHQLEIQNRELLETATGFSELIEKQTIVVKNKLLALTAIYRGSEFIDRQGFSTFANILLKDDESIQALEWVPIVSHEERKTYEYLAQSEGFSRFEFKEVSDNNELISANKRAYYLPIYYLEPFPKNEAALGFDLGSNPERRHVLEQARDSGNQTASPPLELIQGGKAQPGFFIVSPLYEHSGFGVPDNISDRRGRISGYVLGVFNTEQVMMSALKFAKSKQIELAVRDVTDVENPIVIISMDTSNLKPSHSFQLNIANRVWQFSIYPNESYYVLGRDWNSWIVLTGGVILAILLQAFILLVTGFNEAKQEEIEQKTNALRKASKEADNANQAKSNFIANMSHEFRTPLNAIIGLTDLTLKTELSPKQLDYLVKVKSASRTLLSLINDTLDFSKIEAGKMELENITFDLNELLSKIDTLFQYAANEKNIQFQMQKNINISSCITGDPLRIEQVLINLCSNAIKFTEQGSVKVTVSETPVDNESVSLLFSVSDTGIGISPAQQQQLFTSFKQADASTTRKYGGTGLGLTICKRLVELMGGTITLKSKEDQGSTFSFTVICEQSAAPTVETKPDSHQKPPSSTHLLSGLNILVAEDNLVNQLIAEEVLTGFGASVVLADNGKLALDKLNTDGPFSAILMDIQMPEMDGYEATKHIRANPSFKDIPIIAMTANALSSDREECLKAGMNDHIPKPFEPEDVANAILNWTKNRHATSS